MPSIRFFSLSRGGLISAVSLLAVLISWPVAAHAHQGNPDFRSVINRVVPEVPGLEVEIIDFDADIRLTAPPGTEIEIDGYEDEPYARIFADGTVQVNQRSPSAYLNTERYGNAAVPDSADPSAPPEWESTRTDGIFQWHDHRSHWMSTEPPARVADTTERTEVFDYEIPIRVDGEQVVIEGTLFWVGSGSVSKAPFIVGGAVILLVAGAGTLILRRRRDRDGGGKDRGEPGEAW